MADSTRAGRYISQPQGYRAFVPNPLPPTPPVSLDATLVRLLAEAACALGRLDGAAAILREIHAKLLQGVRGAEHTPGEFRRSQNWIGPLGCTLRNRRYRYAPFLALFPTA